MTKVFSWIKTNKLAFTLLLIVVYLLYAKYYSPLSYSRQLGPTPLGQSEMGLKSMPAVGGFSPDIYPREAPPTTDVSERMVISQSYLSLLVKSVVEAQNQIIQKAQSLGGYMVTSNLNNPQDAPTATVVVRVPSNRFQEALDSYRTLAVKVVSENLSGEDITDQFVDNQARLKILETTKAKFEEILNNAARIQDILEVQREIISLQSQIDSVKGQQKYLEQNAKMAKLTIYLSTDELALPYAPSDTWRPVVIFKQAVRSLLGNLRKLGSAAIWLAVYSIIWIPILLIIYFFRKKKSL